MSDLEDYIEALKEDIKEAIVSAITDDTRIFDIISDAIDKRIADELLEKSLCIMRFEKDGIRVLVALGDNDEAVREFKQEEIDIVFPYEDSDEDQEREGLQKFIERLQALLPTPARRK